MSTEPQPNDEQAALWNGTAGQAWINAQTMLDALFLPLEQQLAASIPAGFTGRVLDIGCGTGSTTLAAARRLGPGGECVGVDISEPMTTCAQARAAQHRLPARFLCADAQTHAFAAAGYDRLISRFGVMFFADPVAAFANLHRAAAAEAGLTLLTWRSPEENPFMTTAERAATPLLPLMPARQPDAPGQFAFADAGRVSRILAAAGWQDIDHQPLNVNCVLPEPELIAYFTQLGPLGRALQTTDEPLRQHIICTVRAAFEPYIRGNEVHFTAACWSVTAKASAGHTGAAHG